MSQSRYITILSVLLAAALVVACSSSGARTGGEPAGGEATAEATPEPSGATTEAAASLAEQPGAVQYKGEERGAPLTLTVIPDEQVISFELTVAGSDAACRFTVAGEATSPEQGDLESREDEEGAAHFVAEYRHQGEDCGASISIDLDTRSMAWVSVYDCPRVPARCQPDLWGPLRVQ